MVVLTGPRYVTYYREAFLKPLTIIVGKVSDNVLSFGQLYLLHKNEDIIDECKGFYSKLYNYEAVDESLNDYFFDNLTCLTPDANSLCEGLITPEECWHAIKLMSPLKTPCLDGLPKEFYMFAFKYIGKSFVEMLNNSWEEEN